MTMIFLVVLFITQVISFYLIALLHMKISKFNDLEKKQSRLMKEMDDALAVYLAEVKDENAQLVKEITAQLSAERQVLPKIETSLEKTIESAEIEEKTSVVVPMPQHTMRNYARQSYEAVKKEQEPIEVDDHTRAIQMSVEGYSVEEIAKKLGKGKTEVELILKFK